MNNVDGDSLGEFLVSKLEIKKIPAELKQSAQDINDKENMSSRQNIPTTDDKISRVYLGQSDMQCTTFEYSENDQTSRYKDKDSALKSHRILKANILENTP